MTEYVSSFLDTDKQPYYELFGRHDGVFSNCRSAVAAGLPPAWSSRILAQLPLVSKYERGNGPVTVHAVKAVIALADYAANRGTMTSLGDAARALSAATVAVADPAGASQWLRAEGMDRDEAMRPALAVSIDIAAMLGLWAEVLRGGILNPEDKDTEPRDKDTAVVPVLLSLEQDGVVGTIRVLRIPDGPPGLYPDPTTMAITACDERFRTAIRNAWEAKGIPGQTILWSIDAETNDAFYGDSAGAAFALALDELRRRMGRFGRVRYRRSDNSYVISAALNGARGQLRGVGGLAEKFAGAADAGKKHVVLSEQDRLEGSRGRARSGPDVIFARTLNEAIAVTRRLNPMFVVTLAATVFTLLALIAGGTLAAHKIEGANRQANVGKLLSIVSNLQHLAQQTGTTTLPDLQAKAQYLLTANVLAQQADRPELADQIAQSDLRTSPGILDTINADLGEIEGMYAVGGGTVVTSDKGKITLVDNSNFNVLGTYTLPPGMETINQPIVKALAAAPDELDFATVSQVPVVGPASSQATLDIFSAGGRLTLIGKSSGFTSDQVRELSYSPGGDTLIGVTATRAYFWDVRNAAPRLTGSCGLPAQATAVPVALFPNPKTTQPLIVESDSSIQSLPSWSLNGTGGTCGVTEVKAPWAGKLATLDKSQLTPPTITAGTGTSTSSAMIAAITASGRVKIRSLANSRVITLPIRQAATHVSDPYGDNIAVQVQTGNSTAIQVWNWNASAGSKPVLEAAYPGLQLPGSFPGGNDLATSPSGRIIDALTDQTMTYPTGLLTLDHNAADGTAAGRNSFAVVYARTIAVYSFSARKQPVYLSMPSGYDMESGDNRFDNSVAISQDGRYVAMILSPGTTFGQVTTSPDRKVVVWNVATGLSTDLTRQLGKPTARHRPFDIRFVPGSDDILVNYIDGTLARAHSVPGGWDVSDVLHPVNKVVRFGMETGPGGIYLIERRDVPGSTTSDDRVLRFSYDGAPLKTWDFTSLHINVPSIAPLSDDGVLLIDNGGTAYHLRSNGSIGKPVDLNVQAVLETRQIPGSQQVLIASQGKSETYDLTHDILATGENVGDSAQGIWENFAITTDGRYLIGSDLFDGAMVLGALTPQDRLANLCNLAGGSGMSRQQWAVYVGNLAPYTDPCAQNSRTLNALYNVVRQGEYSFPPQLVQTPTVATASRFSTSCANPRQSGYATYGAFAWGKVGDTEAICTKGTLKWVLPHAAGDTFKAGKVSGHTVLTVTGHIAPEAGSTVNTVIDMLMPDAVADSTAATNGTVRITALGVDVTDTLGDIRVRDTFGPDQDGYWHLEKVVPAGPA